MSCIIGIASLRVYDSPYIRSPYWRVPLCAAIVTSRLLGSQTAWLYKRGVIVLTQCAGNLFEPSSCWNLHRQILRSLLLDRVSFWTLCLEYLLGSGLTTALLFRVMPLGIGETCALMGDIQNITARSFLKMIELSNNTSILKALVEIFFIVSP